MAESDSTREDEIYSEEETVARREAALKRMLATPHEAQKDRPKKRGSREPRRS